MTGQSSDEKFRLTYEACQKIYIHDLLEILVGHVFCCKCHLSPEWRVGRLSAGCRWMRCFLAGQSCSADRGQRIYTHITAHNSPIRKNTRFTWKIPTLRGSPSLKYKPVTQQLKGVCVCNVHVQTRKAMCVTSNSMQEHPWKLRQHFIPRLGFALSITCALLRLFGIELRAGCEMNEKCYPGL